MYELSKSNKVLSLSLPNVCFRMLLNFHILTIHIQDILLAKELLALSPSGQKENSIASQHGVDLILGGHDHLYFVGQGVTSWDNFNVSEKVLGAELDNSDVLVVKSGTDFRDLSEIKIVLESTPKGSVRNKIVKSITGCCQFL